MTDDAHGQEKLRSMTLSGPGLQDLLDQLAPERAEADMSAKRGIDSGVQEVGTVDVESEFPCRNTPGATGVRVTTYTLYRQVIVHEDGTRTVNNWRSKTSSTITVPCPGYNGPPHG